MIHNTVISETQVLKIWIDSSYFPGSNKCSWGAVFNCPNTGEKIKLTGMFGGVKSSTHAEIVGVYEALSIVADYHPNEKFEVRIDCKSIVDVYQNGHKTKDLAIGRVLSKLISRFGDTLEMRHVPGHVPKGDNSEDACRNRDSHELAYNLNKKRRAS